MVRVDPKGNVVPSQTRAPMGPFVPGKEPPSVPKERRASPKQVKQYESQQTGGRTRQPTAPPRPPATAIQALLSTVQQVQPAMNPVQQMTSELSRPKSTEPPEMLKRTETPLQQIAREAGTERRAKEEAQKQAAADDARARGGDLVSLLDTTGGGTGAGGNTIAELARRAQTETQKPRPKRKPEKVEAMTTAEYEALTPEQRAAVDFNTLLVDAVNRDKSSQGEYKKTANATERAAYNETVEDMFGSGHGSELYAPATVAVLDQIKFDDTTKDLDEFLDLRAALTDKDVANIAKAGDNPKMTLAEVPAFSTPEKQAVASQQRQRTEYAQEISEKTAAAIEEQMKRSNAVLADFRSTFSNATTSAITGLGGAGPEIVAPNQDFAGLFDTFTQKQYVGTVQESLAQMRAQYGDQFTNDFQQYLTDRTAEAKRYSLPLGETKGVQYASVDELERVLQGIE